MPRPTSKLNYTSHKALSGAGYLDSKYATGLKVHSVFTLNTLRPQPHRKTRRGAGPAPSTSIVLHQKR